MTPSEMIPRPALIIFDVDGTLFQAQLVTIPAVQRALTAFGLTAPEASAITAWFGKPVEVYHGWLASLCPPGVGDDVIACADREELGFIASAGRLYAGVEDVLTALHAQGHVLATSSNAPQDYFDAVLNTQRIRDFFSIPFCRGMGFSDKTAIVSSIMARCDLRPAIVVGDRHDDIESAHANGALAIGVRYGFARDNDLVDADAFVAAPSQLPQVIAQLLAERT